MKCDVSCGTCVNSATNCITCSNDYTRYNSICVYSNCAVGKFFDITLTPPSC